MKGLSLWFVAALSLTAASTSSGQFTNRNVSKSGTTAASFLEIPVGGRAIALGSAYAAVTGDASTLYWNPAGAARLEGTHILFSHNAWFADLRFDYAATTIDLGDVGTLGLSLTSLSSGDMPVRTVDRPEGTGELFNTSSIAVGLHYARNLSDRFSIGFTGKYIRESIWHMQAQAFAVDIGALFTTPFFNGLRIGALISNFGTDLKLEGRDTRTFIRADERYMGSNDRIPTNIEMDTWPLPLNFQFGVATDVVKDEAYRLTVAVDALHPSDNYESVNVGGEFAFSELLFIRGGYRSLGLFDRVGGFTFGGGILTELFSDGLRGSVDYANANYGRLNAVHILTVAVIL